MSVENKHTWTESDVKITSNSYVGSQSQQKSSKKLRCSWPRAWI